MKKRFFCLSTILLIFSLSAFARPVTGDFTVEVFTSVENISDSEKSWLGSAVEERLEANLSKYTNLKIVNNANKQQILQIQKASEGAAFNEKAMIEVGKYTTAQKGIFVTVRKAGSVYTVAVRVTDLTTGESLATVVAPGKKNIEELYAFSGCSVDFITVELCEQLGISLSGSERHIIMHGESGLSTAEKNKLYEADLEMYSNRIKELNREISSLGASSSLDASFKQSQLEAERALAEEKLKLVRENQRRAAEEERNRQADAQRDAERSAAQRDRINAMSKELNEKLDAVLDAKMEKESVLGQIKIIELKKKSLVEIQQKIDFEKQEILKVADKVIAEKTDEINNRVPRAVETDGRGNLTASAKANRQRDIKEATDKILKQAQSDIKRIKEKIEEQNRELLNDIYDDYKHLGNKTVNTLGSELIVDYGNYDGNRDGWPLFVTVKSDDFIIFQTTSFLPYSELTGKKPVKNYKAPGFEDFANEVDMFQSLFHRGEPILTYELDYSVKPMGLNNPSQYKFYFYSLKYFDTRSMFVRGNSLRADKCGILFLDNKEITKQMIPAYDLRNIEGITDLNYDNTVADIPGYNNNWHNDLDDFEDFDDFDKDYDDFNGLDDFEDYGDYGQYDDSYASDSVYPDYKETKNDRSKGRTILTMNYSFTGIDLPGSAVSFNFASAITNYLFIDLNFDVLIPQVGNKLIYPITKKSSVLFNCGVDFGGNYEVSAGFFKCNLWGSTGLGFNYFLPENNKEEDAIIDFVVACNMGIDFPIGDFFALTVGYGIDFPIGKGMYDKINLGCGFLFN